MTRLLRRSRNQMLDAGFERLITTYWMTGLSTTVSISFGTAWSREGNGSETCNGENGFADFALVVHWHLLAVHLSLA